MGVLLALCLCGKFASACRHIGAEQDTSQLRGPGLTEQCGLGKVATCPQLRGKYGCSIQVGPAFWCFLSLRLDLSRPFPIQKESPPRSLTGQPCQQHPTGSRGPAHIPQPQCQLPHVQTWDPLQGGLRGRERATQGQKPRVPLPDGFRVCVCPHVTTQGRQWLSTLVSQGPGPMSVRGARSPGNRCG